MRVLLFALFMVLATHVSAQEAQGVAAEAPSQQESKDGKANDAQPAANEPSIPVRIVESPEETQRTKDREAASDKHESDDLRAQQEAANAADRSATASEWQVITAWWQVGVGIAGILALLVTIGFTIRATNAAVRSADLAEKAIVVTREMGQIQTRAYLTVTGATISYGRQFTAMVHLKVRNTGLSPAYNVTAAFRATSGAKVVTTPSEFSDDRTVTTNPLSTGKEIVNKVKATGASQHRMTVMTAFNGGWIADYRQVMGKNNHRS